MFDDISHTFMLPQQTKESMAYSRYCDEVTAPKSERLIFQYPRGETLRRTQPGALYRMQKNEEHFQNLRRSKSYLADSYFPPIALLDGNLKELFEDREAAWRSDTES